MNLFAKIEIYFSKKQEYAQNKIFTHPFDCKMKFFIRFATLFVECPDRQKANNRTYRKTFTDVFL